MHIQISDEGREEVIKTDSASVRERVYSRIQKLITLDNLTLPYFIKFKLLLSSSIANVT